MGYTADYEKSLAERLLKIANINYNKILSSNWLENGCCRVVYSCIEKRFIFKKEIQYLKLFTSEEVDEAVYNNRYKYENGGK